MNKIINHFKANWVRHGFETLVVVVGILVAFGLNNWNENRKERLVEKELLEDLQKDLISNRTLLSSDWHHDARYAGFR